MERLRSHREFVAVLRHRRRVTDHDIVVHFRMRMPGDAIANPPADGARRVGLAVAKSVGNAVTRNHVKRRFRVLAARHEDELPEGVDVVMRAKPSAAGADFASIDRQVADLFAAVRRKTARTGGAPGSRTDAAGDVPAGVRKPSGGTLAATTTERG